MLIRLRVLSSALFLSVLCSPTIMKAETTTAGAASRPIMTSLTVLKSILPKHTKAETFPKYTDVNLKEGTVKVCNIGLCEICRISVLVTGEWFPTDSCEPAHGGVAGSIITTSDSLERPDDLGPEVLTKCSDLECFGSVDILMDEEVLTEALRE